MGEDPDAIRDDRAGTGERVGDTIGALGYKADVDSRAKDNVSSNVDTVKERSASAAAATDPFLSNTRPTTRLLAIGLSGALACTCIRASWD